MRKQLFFAAAAGLTLVSAHPPQSQDIGRGTAGTATGYPPCSKAVTDRCIQLHERGVRAPANLALNSPSGRPAKVVRPAPDDIDVTYAGDLRAPSASAARPEPPAAPNVAPQPLRRAEAPRRPHRAHSVQVARLAAEPAQASAYPVCRAGVTDRCRQPQRVSKPGRQVSMRVKRAGERG